jgi:hypothetical protein
MIRATGIERAILAELQEIKRLVLQVLEGQQQRKPSLARTDRTRLERILPAVAGALGSEPFTSRDLAADRSPALRVVLRNLSAKSIGKLLARAEGLEIGGWLIKRCGVEINVTLWRVVVAVSYGEKAAWTAGDRVQSTVGVPDA